MNNDFLDKLKTQSQSIQSSEYIAPQAVTARLHGVRRSRKKAYMSAVAGVLCICVLLSGIVALPQLFGSGVTYAPPRSILKQVANPNHYTDIFGVVKKLKDIAAKEAEAAKAEAANYDNAPIGSDFAGGSAPGGAISNSYDGKYAFSSDETTGQAQLKYSDTNTQVKGVSEADIVKTDGEYIYALKIDYNDMEEVYPADNSEYPEMQAKTYLNINKINNGQITQASRTKLDFYPEEMYVYGDLLIITEVEYTGRYDYSWALSSYYNAVSDIAFRNGYHNTKLHFYNIANHKAPVQSAMLLMQGNCVSTRMINNVLYLVTDYTIPDLQQAEQNSPSSYVPVYKEYDIANGDVVPSNAEDEANATQTTPPPTTIAANAKNASADNATPDTAITESLPPNTSCVPAPDIFICGEPKSAEYITISSIDLNNPTKFADMKSILAGGNQVYCNFNNLFVTVDAYTYNNGWEFTNHTSIVRCAINGTELNIQAEGKVPGS
ncbi:MAG: beta-propeller domain-containing protein, partial [Oscillospiraceae bacterium]|nr:beta-propeller domain-containing protein [Oscillospiraceae bacterium]